MRSLRALGLAALLLVVFALPAQAVRIKDIGRAAGVRGNQLVGYGLVIGLDRTGDTQRSAFTLQSLSSMLSRLGVRVNCQPQWHQSLHNGFLPLPQQYFIVSKKQKVINKTQVTVAA